MPLADHAPAALRGVATTASWFVLIVSLWVADKNRRPNAFAVLVWLAALSALAASMVGCFSFFASQKLERCRHFMAASAALSGFWLFVALLTPTKQRDLGKDGLALAAIAVVAAVVSAALALAATRLEEHGTLITEGCCPARPTLPPCPSCPALPTCPPWCADTRAWCCPPGARWGSRRYVTSEAPETKAVDDAPRLLYPIPGAAEARVVPVDPAARAPRPRPHDPSTRSSSIRASCTISSARSACCSISQLHLPRQTRRRSRRRPHHPRLAARRLRPRRPSRRHRSRPALLPLGMKHR